MDIADLTLPTPSPRQLRTVAVVPELKGLSVKGKRSRASPEPMVNH